MDSHEQLLEKWKRQPRHLGQCFIEDGIIDPNRWKSASPKVLLLLKEAYDEPGVTEGWDLRKFLRENGPKWKIWWTAAYWCYAIHHLSAGGLPSLPNDEAAYESATEALRSSAIVNIKKSAGKSFSVDSDIVSYAQTDGLLLREQVDLIRPSIVVCGSTWANVRHLWGDAESVYDLVWCAGGMVFVDFWHPANHYAHRLNYYCLACILQNSKTLTSLNTAA